MSIRFIHRALFIAGVIVGAYGYFGENPEPQAYYMKLAAFTMIIFAVVLRVIERRRERKH